jgi:putative tricarboxylic transport membrane protein
MKNACIGAVLAAALVCAQAQAAEWTPDKRIEIVIPSGAGGGNDRIARIVQKTMQERRLTDAVVTLTNKPGAGQVVGMAYLNSLPPNGQHIGIASVSFVANYITGRSAIGPGDITPLAHLFGEYVGFAVRPDSKLKGGKDLLAVLKSDPGSISVSMSGGGAGNHNHLALGMVTSAVGGDIRKLKAVGFQSGREATMALLGGHVDVAVSPAATLLPQVQSGQLRMIAITAPKRLDGAYAQVPTWRELGANVVVSNWRVMLAPRGTPPQAVAWWENALARIVETDDWKKMLDDEGLSGHFMKSDETRAYLKSQYEELKAALGAFGMAKQ